MAEIPIQRKEHEKKRSILPMILGALLLLGLLGWCMSRRNDDPAPATDSTAIVAPADTPVAAPAPLDTTVRPDTTIRDTTKTP